MPATGILTLELIDPPAREIPAGLRVLAHIEQQRIALTQKTSQYCIDETAGGSGVCHQPSRTDRFVNHHMSIAQRRHQLLESHQLQGQHRGIGRAAVESAQQDLQQPHTPHRPVGHVTYCCPRAGRQLDRRRIRLEQGLYR